MERMPSFKSDYGDGAHPVLLNALISSNNEYANGYTLDRYCDAARDKIKDAILSSRPDSDLAGDSCGTDEGKPIEIEFFTSGTITNKTALAAMLRPHEAVICTKDGHINTHEAGAIESNGHKVLPTPDDNGILTIESLTEMYDRHCDEGFGGNWHRVKPRAVYLSNATEDGLVYTKSQLTDIYSWCKEHDCLLYVDGARLGVALTSQNSDLTLYDLLQYSDAFSIGGTKNGALLGEALVMSNSEVYQDFRYIMKQNGALLPKSRILGVQFCELFSEHDGELLFYTIARHQNDIAASLRKVLEEHGLRLLDNGDTNQLFLYLDQNDARFFIENFNAEKCEVLPNGYVKVRMATSWSSTPKDIEYVNGLLDKRAASS